jgi:hypothetical protein
MAMYAIVIKFPHENHLEEDETVMVSCIGNAFSLEEAYAKMEAIKERFENEITQTHRTKEYIIGLIALPEDDFEFENAIRYNIDKASYSY